MKNPFDKVDVSEMKKNYAKEIRDLFTSKKVGDTFAMTMFKYKTISQIRALMYHTLKNTSIKYKTKVEDKIIYVLILEV